MKWLGWIGAMALSVALLQPCAMASEPSYVCGIPGRRIMNIPRTAQAEIST